MRSPPPPPTAVTALVLLLVLSASPAVAYHGGATDHYYGPNLEPCASVQEDVEAHCTVEGSERVEVPAEPAQGESLEASVDPRNTTDPATAADDPLPGDDGTRRDAVDTALEPTITTADTTDPLLDTASGTERDAKVRGLDTAESTGLHFRLVCGWDLPLTRPACSVHNPEEDSSLAYARSLRDTTVSLTASTLRQGTTDAARDAAPGVHVTVRVGQVNVEVAGPPALTEGAMGPGTHPDVTNARTLAAPASALSAQGDAPSSPPNQRPTEAPPSAPSSSETTPHAFQGQATPSMQPWRGAAATFLAVAGASTLVALAVLAYRHLERRALLANDTRRAIHDHVGDHPGATIAEAARAADVAHETARYHLQVLAEHGVVVTERVGNRVHHFRTDDPTTRRERLLTALEAKGAARDVYEALRADGADAGGRTLKALASELDLSKSGIHWHLQRLGEMGLVERNGPDGTPRYRAVPR